MSSIERSLDATRRLLLLIVADVNDEQERAESGECQHIHAVEITTLGDRGQVWICPDCEAEVS